MAFSAASFPNISAVRTGQTNHAGDAKAQFLKVFSGEVLTTFARANIMRDLQTMRTISSGKSAQFPATGLAAAVYHTVGENILDDGAAPVAEPYSSDIEWLTSQNPAGSGASGTDLELTGIAGGGRYLSRIKHAERVISIDEILLSAVFMADIDRMMNHYETRSIYSKEIGNALSRSFDKRSIRALILAARSAGNFTGDGYRSQPSAAGGDTIVDSLLKTDGAAIVSALFEAAQIFDERDVPMEERHFLCSPQQYYLIVQQKDVIDRDITSGTNGDFADGTVKVCAGFQLHKTNNLPDGVSGTAALTGENNTYHDAAGFGDNAGVAFHTSAIGTVKLKDLSVETDRKLEYMGDLMVASYALGTGILRPESAVELSVA